MESKLSQKEVVEWLKKQKFTYAKSYSKTFPHEYLTKHTVSDPEMFEQVLLYMRANSTAKAFYSKTYLYFEHGGFEYWEMGRPYKSVVVLNKAPIADDKKYRQRIVTKEERNALVTKMNNRDEYHQKLLKDSDLTIKQQEDLAWLNQNQRKSSNILDNPNKRISLNGLTL